MSERVAGLTIEGVSHAFGGQGVLRDVSLAVASGELVCLLGPSGCGKTTLLRVVAGLEPLQRGRVAIGARPVADPERGLQQPPEARGIGLMFQDYALFPHLTVFENIAFGVDDQGRDRLDWVRAMMARMDIASLADLFPHTLSGGQQQRVALLRALAPRPRVLLLDEPFSGLDVTLRAQVREETLDLLKETGISTLMVTHDPEEAMFMADRILVMNEGTIVQAGTPFETYFRPANAYVAALFGPVNRLSGLVRAGKIRTPIGCFAAPALADGAAAEILIRPEGIRVELAAETADTRTMTVVSARLIGRSSHVRLRCDEGPDGPAIHLHVRVPGTFLPREGTAVTVAIDEQRAFIFPCA